MRAALDVHSATQEPRFLQMAKDAFALTADLLACHAGGAEAQDSVFVAGALGISFRKDLKDHAMFAWGGRFSIPVAG